MAIARSPFAAQKVSVASKVVWSPVLVPLTVALLEQVRVAPSAMVSVADVAGAVIATLLIDVAAATPKTGVTSVGLVAKHAAPLPVSSLKTPAS